MTHVKMLLMEGSINFIGCLQKTDKNDLDKLQVNDSGHNEELVPGDGFSSVSARTSAIKLATGMFLKGFVAGNI